jgi:hypothetical protein
VVKVSHHGSRGNITPSFMKLIRCRTFLISTDGSRFGHPDDEAIETIVFGCEGPPRLIFNYCPATNDKGADTSKEIARKFDAVYPPPGSAGIAVELLDHPPAAAWELFTVAP